MKTRIIGSICVIIVLLVGYVLTQESTQTQPTFSPSANESVLKGLTIN